MNLWSTIKGKSTQFKNPRSIGEVQPLVFFKETYPTEEYNCLVFQFFETSDTHVQVSLFVIIIASFFFLLKHFFSSFRRLQEIFLHQKW